MPSGSAGAEAQYRDPLDLLMSGQAHGEPRLFVDLEPPLATITLNRPEARNAVDPELSLDASRALQAAERDKTIRAIVLTGSGSSFCAGADLKAIAAGRLREIIDVPGGFCGIVKAARSKPLIAAVNGPAIAGGCELSLACDIVIAEPTAIFALPEVSRGIIAGAGGLFRLPQAIGMKAAMEMILTGESIDAIHAERLGLVNRVVGAGAALATAREVALRICRNSPLAVRESRSLAAAAMELTEEELWEINAVAWDRVLASEDSLEGARAFAERRPPRWATEP